jgi:molybdopterin-guanine dinucleotide biosynthesis protein A
MATPDERDRRTGPMNTTDGRLGNVSAALLLGGASERMGSDKARVELAGAPAAVRLAERLAFVCEEVLLVGGEPPEGAPGRRVPDPEGPRCALRGLVGALEAAQEERVLVLATDLFGVTPELLLALIAAPEADVVAPRTERGPEPLCALYRREPALREARTRLAAGQLALHELLGALSVHWLEGDDLAALGPPERTLANVNTQAELAAFRCGAAP